MKKVLLSLLAVAALVLSCQNYDDEFAALNTKIASLESQITSLAELRTAVTGVQSSISALQTAVAAAQAAAEAADNSDAITALATSVAAIAADLVDLQTAIDGATTDADLDALKEELNTTLAALQALIETNSASIAALVTGNTELKAALDSLGVDVDSVLAANASFEGNLTITNASELAYAKSLGNKVATIKGNVSVVVDQTNHTGGGDGTGLSATEVNSVVSQMIYVVGNVKIDTDVSLDLGKLESVSGDYAVLGHDIADDALVSVGGNVLFDYDGAYKSNIQTAGQIYLVAKASSAMVLATSTPARTGTTSIDFLALTKASGVQTTTSSSTHSSGGSLTFGSPDQTGVINVNVGSATTNATTSIKIGGAPVKGITGGVALTTVELHYAADKFGTVTTGVDPLASLSVSGSSITSLTVKAGKITGSVGVDIVKSTLTAGSGEANFPNLEEAGAITSDALENVMPKLTKAGGLVLYYDETVSLPLLTDVTGNIDLSKTTSLSLPKLKNLGTPKTASASAVRKNLTADLVTGAASFPVLELAGVISMDLATSFTAPKADVTSVDIEEATSLISTSIELLAVDNGGIIDEATVTTVKLNGQDVAYTTQNFAAATAITLVGVADATTNAVFDVTIGADGGGTPKNTKLVTLTLGGDLATVRVVSDQVQATASTGNALTALTTINTSGTIRSITITDNYDLTTANLLHTNSTTSSTAPVIVINRNNSLTSIKTGVKSIRTLTINNNYKLTTLDLSSITQLPANWVYGTTSMDITITGNFVDKASSTYAQVYQAANTAAVATNPLGNWTGLNGTRTEATSATSLALGQSGLATLKPFFTTLEGLYNAASGAKDARNVSISLDYKYQSGSPLAVSTESLSFTGQQAGSNTGLLAEFLALQ